MVLSDQHSESEKEKIIKQLNLQPEDKKDFEILEVENDCELREFIKGKQLLRFEYKRGSIFYEFKYDFERISDDKGLIFMDEVGNENNGTL